MIFEAAQSASTLETSGSFPYCMNTCLNAPSVGSSGMTLVTEPIGGFIQVNGSRRSPIFVLLTTRNQLLPSIFASVTRSNKYRGILGTTATPTTNTKPTIYIGSGNLGKRLFNCGKGT